MKCCVECRCLPAAIVHDLHKLDWGDPLSASSLVCLLYAAVCARSSCAALSLDRLAPCSPAPPPAARAPASSPLFRLYSLSLSTSSGDWYFSTVPPPSPSHHLHLSLLTLTPSTYVGGEGSRSEVRGQTVRVQVRAVMRVAGWAPAASVRRRSPCRRGSRRGCGLVGGRSLRR